MNQTKEFKTERKKCGAPAKEIDPQVREAVIHWHNKGLPFKYNAVVSGTTTHYVKRILKEEELYVNKKKSSSSGSGEDDAEIVDGILIEQ